MVTDMNSFSITVQWNSPSNPCSAINGHIISYSIRYTIQPNGIPQTTLQSDGLEVTVRAVTVKIYSVPLSSVLGVVKVVSGTSVVCVESLSPYSTL